VRRVNNGYPIAPRGWLATSEEGVACRRSQCLSRRLASRVATRRTREARGCTCRCTVVLPTTCFLDAGTAVPLSVKARISMRRAFSAPALTESTSFGVSCQDLDGILMFSAAHEQSDNLQKGWLGPAESAIQLPAEASRYESS
jgi:hypothetical protein